MRLFILCAALLAVAGCKTWDPDFMGAGYTHHHELYKAPPGPPAPDLGYAYSAEENAKQGSLWRSVANDLVTKMEQTGITPRPVYVETLPTSNAFNASLDYALREELRRRGYSLVSQSGNNLHIKYEAYRVGDEKRVTKTVYNGDENIYGPAHDPKKPAKFVFTLTLQQGNTGFGSVKTQRTLPAYGYVTGEGSRKVPDRLMEGFLNAN